MYVQVLEFIIILKEKEKPNWLPSADDRNQFIIFMVNKEKDSSTSYVPLGHQRVDEGKHLCICFLANT